MQSNVMTYRRNSDFSYRQDLKALARVARNISERLECMSVDACVTPSSFQAQVEQGALHIRVSNLATCLARLRTTLSPLPLPSSTSQSQPSTSTPSFYQAYDLAAAMPSLRVGLTRRQLTFSVIASLRKKVA